MIRNALLLYLYVLLVQKKEEDQNEKNDLSERLSCYIPYYIMIYTKFDYIDDLYKLINDNLSNRNNKFVYDYYKIEYDCDEDFFIIHFIKPFYNRTIYVKFNSFEDITENDEIIDSFYLNYKNELLFACVV